MGRTDKGRGVRRICGGEGSVEGQGSVGSVDGKDW